MLLEDWRRQIEIEEPPRCHCGSLVKPDIVFFGEDLPKRFEENCKNDCQNADMLIIIGTSLLVPRFVF